jgi:hypothetical protein
VGRQLVGDADAGGGVRAVVGDREQQAQFAAHHARIRVAEQHQLEVGHGPGGERGAGGVVGRVRVQLGGLRGGLQRQVAFGIRHPRERHGGGGAGGQFVQGQRPSGVVGHDLARFRRDLHQPRSGRQIPGEHHGRGGVRPAVGQGDLAGERRAEGHRRRGHGQRHGQVRRPDHLAHGGGGVVLGARVRLGHDHGGEVGQAAGGERAEGQFERGLSAGVEVARLENHVALHQRRRAEVGPELEQFGVFRHGIGQAHRRGGDEAGVADHQPVVQRQVAQGRLVQHGLGQPEVRGGPDLEGQLGRVVIGRLVQRARRGVGPERPGADLGEAPAQPRHG